MKWSRASYRFARIWKFSISILLVVYRRKNINKCFSCRKYNVKYNIFRCNLHKFCRIPIIINSDHIILIRWHSSNYMISDN